MNDTFHIGSKVVYPRIVMNTSGTDFFPDLLYPDPSLAMYLREDKDS